MTLLVVDPAVRVSEPSTEMSFQVYDPLSCPLAVLTAAVGVGDLVDGPAVERLDPFQARGATTPLAKNSVLSNWAKSEIAPTELLPKSAMNVQATPSLVLYHSSHSSVPSSKTPSSCRVKLAPVCR